MFQPKKAYLASRFSTVPECRTKENHKCKFPFEYNGKRYFECTTDGGEDEPWCYQQTGGWGYCKTETCKSSGNLTKQFQSLYSISFIPENISDNIIYHNICRRMF